jgi:hypothetical protein
MTTANGTRPRTRRSAAKQPDPEAVPAEEVHQPVVAESPPPKPAVLPGNGSRPAQTFKIRFLLDGMWYAVTPLQPDPRVMLKAFRLQLLTVDGNSYDVGITAAGKPSCECLGWLNFGRPCRHLRMLHAAGMIQLPPAASANGQQPAASKPETDPPVLPASKPEEANGG